MGGSNIPDGLLVVKTRNSTYRFGQADREGKRTVVKENGEPLPFDHCIVTYLAKGSSMHFFPLFNRKKGGGWSTSPVVSIEAG